MLYAEHMHTRSSFAPVVQWIKQLRPKEKLCVRVAAGAPLKQQYIWLKKFTQSVLYSKTSIGQILVLRRHPRDPEGTTWGLVGGKVDPGEDIRMTAIRETQEEIGHTINPSDLQFIKTYHWDREDLGITFDVFRLHTLTDAVVLELEQEESTEHMWTDPHDLYRRQDLMIGLYPILEDVYRVRR